MGIDRLVRETAVPAPDFSAETASTVLREHFGVEAGCTLLAGERDQNFHAVGADGNQFLLKIWNHSQRPQAVDFLVRLLRFLHRHHPEIPVARVRHSLDEKPWSTVRAENGRKHAACLLTWLDGIFLREAGTSERLLCALGGSLARLDTALAGFRHPDSQRDLLWDVSRAHRLRSLLGSLADPESRQLAERALEEFDSHTRSRLAGLPRQVIHADFNLDNVLVMLEPRAHVSGIIDFGDALEAPRICELAIASAYQLADHGDPLIPVLTLVAAYHQHAPLSESELAALPGLVRARLASSLIITSHMAALHPANHEYLMLDTQDSESELQRMMTRKIDEDAERLIGACAAADIQKP